jgi:6-phosphogluconolactonase
MKSKCILMLIAALAIGASALGQQSDGTPSEDWQDPGASMRGSVYTQTNAPEGNEILLFRRDARGGLKLSDRMRTEGLGTGAGLGSQGALVLTWDARYLYAVNAGSDTISAFARDRRGLVLIDRVSSGGDQPISLTLHDDVLYVLNAGSGNNITGFRVKHDGRLRMLSGSTRPLSGDAVQPAQVLFNNTGEFLIVTEKATSKIDLYSVHQGRADGPFVNDSHGMTPFGFEFDVRDRPIVSEAFGDEAGQSAVSSYDFAAADSPLETISGSVQSGQTSACWLVITANGHYAYVANTGSGTISAYRIARPGELLLLGNGVSANTGPDSLPQDLALSGKSEFLFALTPGSGAIHSFRVNADGSLSAVDAVQGVPASAQGLVAH